MTEQLNLLPCPMCGNSADLYKLDGYHTAMCSCGVRYEGISAERCATAWNRRAAPVVGDDGLPPLPAQHEELQARWKCEDCDGRGYTGEWLDQGYFQPPEPERCGTCESNGSIAIEAYTAEQVRQAQRSAIAPYAERIRQLEVELSAKSPLEKLDGRTA